MLKEIRKMNDESRWSQLALRVCCLITYLGAIFLEHISHFSYYFLSSNFPGVTIIGTTVPSYFTSCASIIVTNFILPQI